MTEFTDLFPWERMTALRTLSKADFLKHEPWIREIDGHTLWCCDQIRTELGLFISMGSNNMGVRQWTAVARFG